jgi:hypothetical protein
MSRPTRRSGVVHAQAECRDCDWGTACYTNALANAAQHAERTGHQVDVEQCIAVTYNPKATTSAV